jgi:hypothetical protein
MTKRSKGAVIGVTMRTLLEGSNSAAPNVQTVQDIKLLLAKGHRVVVIGDGSMLDDHAQHWCRGVFDRVMPMLQMGLLQQLDEIWDTRVRQVEPVTGRISVMPRVYLSPLAEWVAGVADQIDRADPLGEQTLGLVATAMPGHTETYMSPALGHNELLTYGVLQAARLDIEGKAHSFYAGTEDDGHLD